MHAVVGTIPEEDFPLVCGPVTMAGEDIAVGQLRVPVNRGTPALLAAAAKTAEYLIHEPVYAYLIGDTGPGHGSRRLYRHLCEHLAGHQFHSITFHYLQPDVDWHNRVLFALEELTPRPLLIADAGFMYAAKMSGQAAEYDLFTPDVGELTFLADESAPHPFYTRGFILHDIGSIPDLIKRAYVHNNASRYLMVKGKIDYIAGAEGILEEIAEPCEEALEAIGGTGDTLTGIAAVLCGADRPIPEAAAIAARVNRLAGAMANPTPATQVIEIIRCIPRALDEVVYV